MTARVLEQLSDPLGADASVDLDEFRAAAEEKRHVRLTGNRAREKRLAGSRWPDEQHALGNAPADRRKAVRLAKEFDNLLHFLLGFIHTGDVGKRHRRLFLHRFLSLVI